MMIMIIIIIYNYLFNIIDGGDLESISMCLHQDSTNQRISLFSKQGFFHQFLLPPVAELSQSLRPLGHLEMGLLCLEFALKLCVSVHIFCGDIQNTDEDEKGRK